MLYTVEICCLLQLFSRKIDEIRPYHNFVFKSLLPLVQYVQFSRHAMSCHQVNTTPLAVSLRTGTSYTSTMSRSFA